MSFFSRKKHNPNQPSNNVNISQSPSQALQQVKEQQHQQITKQASYEKSAQPTLIFSFR